MKIITKNLYKIYQSGSLKQKIETVALKNVSFTVQEGDFITVMGPSGSGKTTLLQTLTGFIKPSAGDIVYENSDGAYDLTKMDDGELDVLRRRGVGMLFQSENLIEHLTALENVQLPLKFLNLGNLNKAEEILTELGLKDRFHHRVYQLSAGERQRVALASILSYSPDVIFADEPTGELDSETTKEVMEFFKKIQKERKLTFFVVTHNPQVASYGNRFLIISDGQIMERDTPFSYKDFATELGEYYLDIDKMNRVMLPQALLEEMELVEGILKISFSEETRELHFVPIKEDEYVEEADSFLGQVNNLGRLLLPREISSRLESKSLVAQYDEIYNMVIIKERMVK